MIPFIEPSPAQASYDGPEDLRLYADFLPAIGEVVITFSRVERRLTWAIESIIGSTREDAHQMEDFVKNLSARLSFLELVGRPVARETNTEAAFSDLLAGIKTANTFRNLLLHNGFTGTRFSTGSNPNPEITKHRHHVKPEKMEYQIPLSDIRSAATKNLALCTTIQRWVLAVRPGAENRVP